MAIVTGYTKRLDIPHEPGQWMTIRQLSKRQRERAADARTDAVLTRVKGMGLELLREFQGQARPDVQAAMADGANAYDWVTVLQYGLEAWSYEAPLTIENIENLDEATADWAFREVLAFSGPLTEDERKNG